MKISHTMPREFRQASITADAVKVEVPTEEKQKEIADRIDVSWLPFAAKLYNISPNIEDYLLIPTIICPSDIPNRNGIAFPAAELARFIAPPVARQVYKAWTGCPVHEEHQSAIHTDAHGVVFDSYLTPIAGYGNGKYWKVMGVAGIDTQKSPDMAHEFVTKQRDTFSMGCNATEFRCSICGAEATKTQWKNCSHIQSTDTVNWREENGQLVYLNAYGLEPVELSIVENPAWAVALSQEILSSPTQNK